MNVGLKELLGVCGRLCQGLKVIQAIGVEVRGSFGGFWFMGAGVEYYCF